jgi:hypothetical protein
MASDRRAITESESIDCENPTEEVWKHLRYFLETAWVEDQIYELHKASNPKRADIKKQAVQLAYCIRQGEEYFRASATVGLATKPNLLYYGVVSLSKALVLLKLDGNHSFDALRKSGNHRHHGLELFGAVKRETNDVKGFFSDIGCRCHTKDLSLWGHFAQFYASIAPPVYSIHEHMIFTSEMAEESQFDERLITITSTDIPATETLIATTYLGLDLIRSLPDLQRDITQKQIAPIMSPGMVTFYRHEQHWWGNDAKDWHFHIDCEQHEQQQFITLYREKNPRMRLIHAGRGTLQFGLDDNPNNETQGTDYLPNAVQNLSGVTFFIREPDKVLPELLTQFMLLFILGMYCRYHADVWMRIIDNVQIADFTNTLLKVCHRKFPNLILDQLMFTQHLFTIGPRLI